METSPVGVRGFIPGLKRLFNRRSSFALIGATVAISSCRDVSAPPDPAALKVLSVALSLPPGRSGFIEGDTVTVYATVVDRNGVSQPGVEVEWSGPIVRTGAQTGLATLKAGTNAIIGRLANPGQSAIEATISVSANHALSVAVLSLPPGRGAFVEWDTVTVFARVVDRNGVSQPDVEVEWSGPIVRTGAQTGLATLNAGINTIVGRVGNQGQSAVEARLSLSADRRPAEMLVWLPDGTVTRIPAPPGVAEISPTAINDRGEIVGSLVDLAGRHRAFIWSSESGFTELTGSFGGQNVFAVDVNDEGVVAGTVWWWGNDPRAFVWSREEGFKLISDQPEVQSGAYSINRRGIIAGVRNGRPVLWSRDGSVTSYAGGGSPPPSYETHPLWSYAIAVNDNDEVLASWNGRYARGIDWSWVEDGYPSVWTGMTNVSLGCPACVVSSMNNRREVVGVSWQHGQAFKWASATGVELLVKPPTGESTEAVAINDSGTVAGSILSWAGAPISRAAVWAGATLTPIPAVPGVRNTSSRDINTHGHVLVHAR